LITGLIWHLRAIAAFVASSTTFLFGTGSDPGSPMQTGHMLLFGTFEFFFVEQLQYALVSDFN